MALSILIFLRRGKVGHLLSSVDEQLAGGTKLIIIHYYRGQKLRHGAFP